MTDDQKPADKSELNEVVEEMNRFTKKVGDQLSGLFGGKKSHTDDSAPTEPQPPAGDTPAG